MNQQGNSSVLALFGGGRLAGGSSGAGEPQGAHADPLGYLARREAACGGTATAAGGGDGSGLVAVASSDSQG
jgi:hypothetical protein